MRKILLGRERSTKLPVHIPMAAFPTHFHMIGSTGKGKTTAIHRMLHEMLLDAGRTECHILFDRLGGISHDLLLWMASEFCTEDVRRRLIYIEPSREDVILGFNPLTFDTQSHGFYKVARATDIILRAWASQNIEEMPRLARWTFNSFWAAAQLGLTVADCVHFLMPGSPYHARLLDCLPPRLKYEWQEIMGARSGEAARILESTRNRLKPYFESDILRRMFGSTTNRLDIVRFMREGKIVVLNLASGNRLSEQLSDALGGLMLNEVLTTARSRPTDGGHPTYLWLDEFQRFVGPDIEAAIPEMRQLGVRLILSHQSFSQLKRGDLDLTSLIFQAQSRMMFGVQGEDADLLAHEIATLKYDARKVKEEIWHRKQLTTGHKIIELASRSTTETLTKNWNETFGRGWSRKESTTLSPDDRSPTRGEGTSRDEKEGRGHGEGTSQGGTVGSHETLVPIQEEYSELSSRSYETFDEQKTEWAKKVRKQKTGSAILGLVDDGTLYEVDVKRDAPGHLGFGMKVLREQFPEALEAVERLKEENFRSDLFVSPAVIDAETERRLEAVLRPAITIQSSPERLTALPECKGEGEGKGENPLA